MSWRRGRSYSQDLRERVLAVVDGGMGVYAAAALLRVSVSWIYKVLARRRATGETAARPQRNHVRPKLAALYDTIRAEVNARPDITLAELRRWLAEQQSASISLSVLCSTLAELGLTRKKRRSGRPSRTAPMSPQRVPPGAPISPI